MNFLSQVVTSMVLIIQTTDGRRKHTICGFNLIEKKIVEKSLRAGNYVKDGVCVGQESASPM